MGFFDNLAEKAKQLEEEAQLSAEKAEKAEKALKERRAAEVSTRAAEARRAAVAEEERKAEGKRLAEEEAKRKIEEELAANPKSAADILKKERIKNMILTTLDLKRDYEIIDVIVSAEVHMDERFDYEAGKISLKERAAEIGADAVIGVQCFLCNIDGKFNDSGNRRWYGTAVKFK